MDNDALFRRISAVAGSKRQGAKQPVQVRGSHDLYSSAEPEPEREPSSRYHQQLKSRLAPDAIVEPEGESNQLTAPAPFVAEAPPLDPEAQPEGTTVASLTAGSAHGVGQQSLQQAADEGVDYDIVSSREPLLLAEHDPKTFYASFLPGKVQVESDDTGDAAASRRIPRPRGFIVSCSGTKAVVQGDTDCIDSVTGLTWSVGRMLSIRVGESRVVGMICDISVPDKIFVPSGKTVLHFHVELQGEVCERANGKLKFSSGISTYPSIGCEVHQIRAIDLEAIFSVSGNIAVRLGFVSQDERVPAVVDIADMLSKHFAILGSTGSGKSASITVLLHAIRAVVPELRTIILDPHNEYGRAFPSAKSYDAETLDIPFWMFQLEEYTEVLYRGRTPVEEEIEILRELIPQAKARFQTAGNRVALRAAAAGSAVTADSVTPYRLADLLALLAEEAGQLESRFDRTAVRALRARILAHAEDPRYAFMFRHRTITDVSQQVVSDLFNLEGSKDRQTIIQLGGMPMEVLNSVAAILARMTFELAVAARGRLKLLVMCEEAHRYVPADKNGFEPARRAVSRIAKEGRKYGAFVGIITQRPSELEPTILSQCSTVFAMRLTNHIDQNIVRQAISSSSENSVGFLSSLANQECIAFGEGAPTPLRMKFFSLPKSLLPGAESGVFEHDYPPFDERHTASLVEHWRKLSG